MALDPDEVAKAGQLIKACNQMNENQHVLYHANSELIKKYREDIGPWRSGGGRAIDKST